MNIPTLGLPFYLYTLPILALLAGSLLLLLCAVSKTLRHPAVIFICTLAFIVAALVSCLLLPQPDYQVFAGAYVVDSIARFGQILVLTIALCILWFGKESYLHAQFLRGDVCSIFLITLSGMMVMVSSYNLLTIFVGLEIFSLGTYALIGYIKQTQPAQEAAIKYFVLGSFAAAILLFGFAFLYAATGTLDLNAMLAKLPANNNLALVGSLFAIVGLAFKLALVPCHLWTPDAYEGAPTVITAFMATTAKAVTILLAVRFLNNITELNNFWMPVLTLFAALSMIVGNVMALVQNSLKRMLAYSSIAHGGYIAIALVALGTKADSQMLSSTLYYLIAYCIISIGTFALIMRMENETRTNIQLEDLTAFAKTHPYSAAALAVFMFAFAGIPPTLGFFAKFFVFKAGLEAGLYTLVIIGIIGSAISFYYYLRVILNMYFVPSTSTSLARKDSLPLSAPQDSLPLSAPQDSLPLSAPQDSLPLSAPQDSLPLSSSLQLRKAHATTAICAIALLATLLLGILLPA